MSKVEEYLAKERMRDKKSFIVLAVLFSVVIGVFSYFDPSWRPAFIAGLVLLSLMFVIEVIAERSTEKEVNHLVKLIKEEAEDGKS